jgi:hypothetical protein
MHSTEEKLVMENKLFEAKEAFKKVKEENSTLKENFENSDNNHKSEENPAGASLLATKTPSPSKALEYRKSIHPSTQDLKPFPPSPGLDPAETLQL